MAPPSALPPFHDTLWIERWLGDAMRRRLPAGVADFVMFGLKQGWAALFGGLLLALIIATHIFWPADASLARYDFLFIAAVVIQVAFLAFRLESWSEARVIVLFHLTGTVMEIFKVHMGSWAYPEAGLIKIAGVPLFSGFMYASVGSYIARVIRIFHMRFARHPPLWASVALAVAIYLNFFTHHFMFDMRWVLMAATLVLFWRCRIWFRIGASDYFMPLIVAALLSAVFLYIAENVGTLTGTWIYAGQTTWHPAGLGKFGSWYLLLFVSFAQVSVVFRHHLFRNALPSGAVVEAGTGKGEGALPAPEGKVPGA
ncbi:MAG: DUF817 domain-containing protein [Devosia sp.]